MNKNKYIYSLVKINPQPQSEWDGVNMHFITYPTYEHASGIKFNKQSVETLNFKAETLRHIPFLFISNIYRGSPIRECILMHCKTQFFIIASEDTIEKF